MRRFGVMLSLLSFSVACHQSGPIPNIPIQKTSRLTAFNECGALENYVEDQEVKAMQLLLSNLRSPWGGPLVYSGVGSPGTAVPDTRGNAAPGAYTSTNNQVAGVDEGDIVKNDGTHIFALRGQNLFIAQSWPVQNLALLGQLKLDGYPTTLFLKGSVAVVLANIYNGMDGLPGEPIPALAPGALVSMQTRASISTRITRVDVSDLTQPKVLSQTDVPGWYVDGRQTGSTLRLVIGQPFDFPQGVSLYPDMGDHQATGPDDPIFVDALEKLSVANEKVIRHASLSDWFPAITHTVGDGKAQPLPLQCASYAYPSAPETLANTQVVSLSMDDATQAPTVVGLLAQASVVYASTASLYVGSEHWWFWPEPGQVSHTYLYKMDLSDSTLGAFVAAGGVDGSVLNAYSLDEQDGLLRIATSLIRRVEDAKTWWGRVETSNRVSVLEQQGANLSVVGQTSDFSKGESLYAARFLGTKGFITTYQQVDPLITVDLSNPKAPKVVGTLQVPGYSTYLYPLDEGHLLALGAYAPTASTNGGGDVDNGGSGYLQLSLFDVTDLAHPRQSATLKVGTWTTSTEAEWEPHAFTYFKDKGLLALPFSDYSPVSVDSDLFWAGFVSDLRVFHVHPSSGFAPLGSLGVDSLYTQSPPAVWSDSWSPQVRRSIFADDFVYAISDAGIRVANVADLTHPVASLEFPAATP